MKTRRLKSQALVRYGVQALFYPTLGWNMLLGRTLQVRRWWDEIDRHVLMGAFPFARDVPRLAAAGVRGVVNTCREYAGPLAAYQAAGIRQLHIPTIDFHPPLLNDILQAVEFIDDHVARGEGVYVHCKAGRGRSATVVLCWLIKAKGMTPEEAQSHLLARRPHVHRRLHLRQVVREFCDRRHGVAAGTAAEGPAEIMEEAIEAAHEILEEAAPPTLADAVAADHSLITDRSL
jgi:atypical dual specificity phosphatase